MARISKSLASLIILFFSLSTYTVADNLSIEIVQGFLNSSKEVTSSLYAGLLLVKTDISFDEVLPVEHFGNRPEPAVSHLLLQPSAPEESEIAAAQAEKEIANIYNEIIKKINYLLGNFNNKKIYQFSYSSLVVEQDHINKLLQQGQTILDKHKGNNKLTKPIENLSDIIFNLNGYIVDLKDLIKNKKSTVSTFTPDKAAESTIQEFNRKFNSIAPIINDIQNNLRPGQKGNYSAIQSDINDLVEKYEYTFNENLDAREAAAIKTLVPLYAEIKR